MLTVYSAHGSPGASTTAMYLAAQWASTGTEVLLIEADPGGGSLSHHLGIQFTPGSASFVASGMPVRGGNLIDHSQDVLFNNLHVMPATSSPTGAREIVRWLDERAGELRAVSETEMAVIVDGGRITADSVAADLAMQAAGVAVVARGDSSPTSLEYIGSLLSAEASGSGVERCAVTVGDSPLSAEEWREKCDLTFAGSIKEFAEVTGDLSAFLNRNKRKSKRWRVSLEEVAEQLLPYAKPPASAGSRPRRSGAGAEQPAATEPAPPPPGAVQEAEAPAIAAAADEREIAHEVHDEVPAAGMYAEAPPQPDPYHEAAAVYDQVPPPVEDPRYPASPVPPSATAPPPAAGYPHYPPEGYPDYFEPPSAPPEVASHEAPLPVYQPPPGVHEPPYPQQPGYPIPPEVHPQQEMAPPWAAAPQEPPPYQPQPFEQHPPPVPDPGWPAPPAPDPGRRPPHETPPAYPQQPPHGPPAAGPPGPHPHPAPPPYQVLQESAPAPQPAAYQQPRPGPGQEFPARDDPAPAPPPEPPVPPSAPTAHVEAPPTPSDLMPSGSFRDWASRLHGEAPEGTSNSGHGGAS